MNESRNRTAWRFSPAHRVWAVMCVCGSAACALAWLFAPAATGTGPLEGMTATAVLAVAGYAALTGRVHWFWSRELPRRGRAALADVWLFGANHVAVAGAVAYVLLRGWHSRCLLLGLEFFVSLAGTIALVSLGLTISVRLVGDGWRPTCGSLLSGGGREKSPGVARLGLPWQLPHVAATLVTALGLLWIESLPLPIRFAPDAVASNHRRSGVARGVVLGIDSWTEPVTPVAPARTSPDR
ncbi:MAG: hypothetical protein J5I93_01820 [Pirellulaceae bacterium]|nr:hypothetical protein [Pirellulaceae bacterium]